MVAFYQAEPGQAIGEVKDGVLLWARLAGGLSLGFGFRETEGFRRIGGLVWSGSLS